MLDQNQIYKCKGSHYEMGLQQGKFFKENAEQVISRFKNLEEIQGIKPKLIPTNIFLNIASWKAKKELSPLLEEFAPNQASRIKGIAEGSGLKENFIYLFCAAELFLGELDWELPHLKSGCTSIAYTSNKIQNAHTMISRNFDYSDFIVPFLMVRKNIPKGYNKTWDLTAMVLPGTFNGVNEHGVFISTNEAFPLDERHKGLSASLLIQEALEKCSSTQEVIKFFRKMPRGSGNVILVADPSDDLRVMEYTSNRLYIRKLEKDETFLVATNHYSNQNLKAIDLPREAVFGKDSPQLLQGICINKTSYVRKETAETYLRRKDKININDIKTLHRDHSADPEGTGGMETICHHDPINISAASMIIDLHDFYGWFCFGSPCQNKYHKFHLK